MFLSIVLEQRIKARAERALNIGDYDANDVDGKANLGSSDDHDDDEKHRMPRIEIACMGAIKNPTKHPAPQILVYTN